MIGSTPTLQLTLPSFLLLNQEFWYVLVILSYPPTNNTSQILIGDGMFALRRVDPALITPHSP